MWGENNKMNINCFHFVKKAPCNVQLLAVESDDLPKVNPICVFASSETLRWLLEHEIVF